MPYPEQLGALRKILTVLSPREVASGILGLRRFLADPRGADDPFVALRRRMEQRTRNFCAAVQALADGNPRNPCRQMMELANLRVEDALGMARADGIEQALCALYDAGVHLALDELRGRIPVVRSGRTLAFHPEDVRSTPAEDGFTIATGGSRGRAARIRLGYAYLAQNAVNLKAAYALCAGSGAPLVQWFPVLPNPAGLMNSLTMAHARNPIDRWFAQTVDSTPAHRLTTAATLAAARAFGQPLAPPVRAELSGAHLVLRTVLRLRDAHGTVALNTYVSSAVRVAQAALRRGARLDGVHLLTTSEPLTAGRRNALEEAGAQVTHTYWVSELGLVGVACPECRAGPDELHIFEDQVAVWSAQDDASETAPLHFTPLLPCPPFSVLNLEVGDAARLHRRPCGCPLGRLGMTLMASRVRSFSRANTEGMTLPVTELAELVDSVLPKRFGGGAGAYQLREEEHDGGPRLVLRADPSLGPLDEAAVRRTALEFVRAVRPVVAEVLAQAGAFQVERAEPERTSGGKVHPVLLRYSGPSGGA